MKYCVPYDKLFKYNNEIDEITINFNRTDKSLLDFLLLQAEQSRRVNIFIYNTEEFVKNDCIKLFESFMREHPDLTFVLMLPNFKDSEKVYDQIIESDVNIPFFFNTFVKDWDTLNGLMNLYPCDMYIVEDLCFQIKDVAGVLHDNNIRVRTLPNVAQSAWGRTPALKKFFIRPEDVDIYEPYIDVLEFFGEYDKKETYYRIYAKDKKWSGKLSEIIIDLDLDIDSRCLLPFFAERRLNCGKRCLKGRKCQICEATKQLAAVLEEQHLMFTSN